MLLGRLGGVDLEWPLNGCSSSSTSNSVGNNYYFVEGVLKLMASFWKEIPRFVTKCDTREEGSQFYPKLCGMSFMDEP